MVESVDLGRDGKVQVVTIRTFNGMYKRAVTKLVLIINDNSRGLLATGESVYHSRIGQRFITSS